MNNRTKLTIALVTLALAAVLYIWLSDPFAPAAGAGKTVDVDCAMCKFHGTMGFDKAIATKGSGFSAETGWSIPCPSCGKPASVRPQGMAPVATQSAAAR